MIVDCCTYYNEADMWRLRYEELRDVVDRFVVVEAMHTHSGHEKALTFSAPVDAPVTHWPMTLPEPGGDGIPATRRREMTQRNGIAEALRTLDLPDDAIILISDVDEIPRAGHVKLLAEQGVPDGHIVVFRQRFFYYNVNTVCVDGDVWLGTRAARWADVRACSPHVIRYGLANGDNLYPRYVAMGDAGWHLSYFGGVEQIRDKLAAFLHQELVDARTTDPEYIQDRIARATDLYDRTHGHRFMPATLPVAELPAAIAADPQRWRNFFAEGLVPEGDAHA